MRRPYRSLAVGLVFGFLVVAAIYVFGMAFLQSRMERFIAFGDLIVPRLNDVVLATFFFVVGASVGSFLNVVAWRLPRGGSVNGHSYCPRCHNPLRARDNVPVLGWLWLGGRCRDCLLPISPRYPIVETVVGVGYAVLGTVAVLRFNLPHDDFHAHAGVLWIPDVPPGILVTLAFHLVGLAILWAMVLIRIDGVSVPATVIRFAVGFLVVVLFAHPPSMVAPWQMSLPKDWPAGRWVDQALQVVMRLLTSVVAAGFFARVLGRSLAPGADLKSNPLGSMTRRLLDLSLMLGVAAVMVGWQATIGVVVVAAVLARMLCSRIARRFPGSESWDGLAWYGIGLVLATTIQLVAWRLLVDSRLWPSELASRGVVLAWLAVALTIPSWLSKPLHRDVDRSKPTPAA